MHNRDYFKKPIQSGGRTAHDYGHTRLGEPPVDMSFRMCAAAGVFTALVILYGLGVFA